MVSSAPSSPSSAAESLRVSKASANFRCFDAYRRAPVASLFCFCNLAGGYARTLLRRSRDRRAGKREKEKEEKGFCFFRSDCSGRRRRGRKKSEEKKERKKMLLLEHYYSFLLSAERFPYSPSLSQTPLLRRPLLHRPCLPTSIGTSRLPLDSTHRRKLPEE